ncbi:MAG: prolyl-tRNA synthetase associated domain-containing protein [Candidatus Lokiarchaeota archaeon]|nr:prolyl-tRNA synthetase associated domain-containing protein [Candidatus Lokiarchaeota archaeon]
MENSIKQWLVQHKIQYILHTHPAVFTVPEAKIHCGHIPGTHCKNLVLKNKKTGQLYLITIPYDKKLDLNQFRKMISAPKIRFATGNELSEALGIKAGAVSPLALINDKNNNVIFMIEESIWNAEEICCHPNINTETLQIPKNDFQKLIRDVSNNFEVRKDLPYSFR